MGKNFLRISFYLISLSLITFNKFTLAEKNNFRSKTQPENNKSITWEKYTPRENKKYIWKKISGKEFNKIKNFTKEYNNNRQTNFRSFNRSIVFNDNLVGPDISWLVPPGLSWSRKYKFDASVRGHSRREDNESFFGWNNGDAVGQFYYQFLNLEKSTIGLNFGMRSVYQGENNKSSIGEGLSAGYRWDYELSDDAGIAFGAEQLVHFDGLTDTGRDIYLTATKVFGNKSFENPFPLYVVTGGLGTGKLSEGVIKGLCSDLFGGAGNHIKIQNRLCWAPIFSIARVSNQKFSTFLEYNSHSFILGTSYAPVREIPLRGTLAVKLTDEDNYDLNNFSDMTWVFRLSLGF